MKLFARKIMNKNKDSTPTEPVAKKKTLDSTKAKKLLKKSSIPTVTNTSKMSLPSTNNKPMVYNPYGTNYSTLSSSVKTDSSFYLHEGSEKIRILQLPIADPNMYLPEEYHQDKILLYDNYKFDTNSKSIGTGCTCEVKIIRSVTKRSEVYALKKLNMIYDEDDESYYKRCAKEFVIAKYLNTEPNTCNIIGIFDLCKIPTTTSSVRSWGYVMELGQVDLFQLITRVGWKRVPVNEKLCVFKQICDGVRFMHSVGVAHRDMKPENVLLSQDGVCKITDFGISTWIHETPKDMTSPIKKCKGMIGSPPYTPPEVMYFDSKKNYHSELQQPYDPVIFDCYSLGVMLFTIMNGIIPFIESCDRDKRFKEYCHGYENYISYNNKEFRNDDNSTKQIKNGGPGMEYSFAKLFPNRDISRVAWRLADPQPNTRLTLTKLYENEKWFDDLECCDKNKKINHNHLNVTSSISSGWSGTSSSTSSLSPTPLFNSTSVINHTNLTFASSVK